MREILFRGKNVDGGGWLEGDLVQNEEGAFIVAASGTESETDLCAYVWCKVDPETVGQYTGLKDSKGKEIYEGDVIRITYNTNYAEKRYTIHEVVYHGHEGYPAFELVPTEDVEMNNLAWLKSDADPSVLKYAVIGNKFDNPELLEGVE